MRSEEEELQDARTIIHDKVEGHLAMILNAAYGSNVIKNRERRPLKIEKTSKAENDFHTHDLKATYDDDRNTTVALIEIKTTLSKKRTLNDIVNQIFIENGNQLFSTTQLAIKQSCLWCFVIAIYRDDPLKIHKRFNEDDYNILVMFGHDSIEYSYHYYYSFAQLEDTIRYYKTLSSWLNSDLVFKIEEEKSFHEVPVWTTFPKSQLSEELNLTYDETIKDEISLTDDETKRSRKKIVINEEQANALRFFCSQKRRTIQEVADFLKIHRNTVGAWRSDSNNPNHDLLIEVLGDIKKRNTKEIVQEIITPGEDMTSFTEKKKDQSVTLAFCIMIVAFLWFALFIYMLGK